MWAFKWKLLSNTELFQVFELPSPPPISQEIPLCLDFSLLLFSARIKHVFMSLIFDKMFFFKLSFSHFELENFWNFMSCRMTNPKVRVAWSDQALHQLTKPSALLTTSFERVLEAILFNGMNVYRRLSFPLLINFLPVTSVSTTTL